MSDLPSQPAVCEQCGHPLDPGNTAVGCLHCLLGEVHERPDATRPAGASPPPSTDGGALYHHYQILQREDGAPFELGRGAMGVTYKAMDVNLHVPVALKVIDADYATHPRARELFLREARSAARLRHPNVATVYHFGTRDPAPATAGALVEENPEGTACFYAMEFVDGETLDARVRRLGPLPPRVVLEIALQIARALVAAEERGLVHRDLKPANIMLADEGATAGRHQERAWVKVIDFGLAKVISAAAADGSATTSSVGPVTHGAFVGTPGFASPEQFELANVDVRSDVYSLGATLWYALTGHLPYEGDTLAEVHDRQVYRPPPVAQLADVHTPAPLVELLVAMLAPDPARRPASARALCDAVDDCLARVQTGPGRFRRRWAVGAAAVAILGALALAAFHPWPRAAREPAKPAAPPIPEKSVAVLPFQNLSADKDSEFFTDGVQDEVLTNLAKVSDLRVISRSSVIQYKGGAPRDLRAIAAELGVTYVVEGSVQRAGSRVRVNAQLIDARTDAHQWAEHYDRSLDDVFTIQSDIAQAIADQLRAHISPAEHAAITVAYTTDILALQLYQQALELDDHVTDPNARASLFQAVTVLGQALKRDPKFVPAWCLLSEVQMDLYWNDFDHTDARRDLARAAVEEAVRLQPDASDTHVALAAYYYYGLRDYDRALAELTPVLRREPNNTAALANAGAIHRRLGRWDDTIHEWESCAELDPRHLDPIQALAEVYAALGRYPEATHSYNRALEISHGNVEIREILALLPFCERADLGPWHALNAAILAGEPAAVEGSAYFRLYGALAEHDQTAAQSALAAIPVSGWQDMNSLNLPRDWFIAITARTFGDEPGAQRAFTTARAQVELLVRDQPNYALVWSSLGLIDAGLGRKEEAIREGRRACELLPLSRDAWEGPALIGNLAEIYAWTGEKTLAIEQLGQAVRQPSCTANGSLFYGDLKRSPRWNPLRGDPEFETLVASLAPKTDH